MSIFGIEHRTVGPKETEALAAKLAEQLAPGDVVALFGELGAGKTVFVRGLARALGVRETVHSPTYTLIHEYHGVWPVYHMDWFRLSGPAEVEALDFQDYCERGGITLIEWADRAESLLPARTIRVELDVGHMPEERRIHIRRPPVRSCE